jgi:DNA-directed RNA polymerase subunit alpha
MFQVNYLKSTAKTPTEYYSKYSIGPFIKGQSTTIGNALRRVLLSNLQGLAITGVRIKGIDHEFSTITNIKEDVVDILLNIKQIILKGNITEPVLARLKAPNSGIITAGMMELPNNVSLVDPRQYLASMTSKGDLEMEFVIDCGQNYVPSGKIDPILPPSFLSIDAVFMPVTKVNFFVETSRGNVSSQLESLILEIWTNGSITPSEALSSSAEILENTFKVLKITDAFTTRSSALEDAVNEGKEEHLESVFIEELELSVRAYNCLKRANVHTISDLLEYTATDLLEFKNFGQKSADEVCENLKKRFDLNLKE